MTQFECYGCKKVVDQNSHKICQKCTRKFCLGCMDVNSELCRYCTHKIIGKKKCYLCFKKLKLDQYKIFTSCLDLKKYINQRSSCLQKKMKFFDIVHYSESEKCFYVCKNCLNKYSKAGFSSLNKFMKEKIERYLSNKNKDTQENEPSSEHKDEPHSNNNIVVNIESHINNNINLPAIDNINNKAEDMCIFEQGENFQKIKINLFGIRESPKIENSYAFTHATDNHLANSAFTAGIPPINKSGSLILPNLQEPKLGCTNLQQNTLPNESEKKEEEPIQKESTDWQEDKNITKNQDSFSSEDNLRKSLIEEKDNTLRSDNAEEKEKAQNKLDALIEKWIESLNQAQILFEEGISLTKPKVENFRAHFENIQKIIKSEAI